MGNTELSLNEKIIALRKKHGLSQNKMAEAADITFRTYQNIEYGRTQSISLEDALKLSLAFGIHLSEMIKESEYEKYSKAVQNGPSMDPKLRELFRLITALDTHDRALLKENVITMLEATLDENQIRALLDTK